MQQSNLDFNKKKKQQISKPDKTKKQLTSREPTKRLQKRKLRIRRRPRKKKKQGRRLLKINKRKSSKKLKNNNKRKKRWLNFKRLGIKQRIRKKSNPLKQLDQIQWFLNQWTQSNTAVTTPLKY